MREQVTLKDLSEDLGYSISTISKALNDSHEISEETKVKVKKAALIHGYVPNILARYLTNNSIDVIGVTVPQINAIDYKKLFKEVINIPQLKNCKDLVYQSGNNRNDLTLFSKISERDIQGIIVLFSNES